MLEKPTRQARLRIFLARSQPCGPPSRRAASKRGLGWRAALLSAVICLGLPGGWTASAEEPEFLWPAPETSSLGGALFSGYSFSEQVDGVVLGARMMFFFRYLIASLGGDVKFGPEGPAYAMTVDLTARYGPVYAGVLLGLHWLPGRGGDPSTGLGGQVGLFVPTGINGLWLDLGYRPNLIFLEGQQLSYHAIQVGLLIEAGL